MVISKFGYILVDEKTNEPAVIGTEIIDFRGSKWKLQSGEPPHKPSSTGRIYVSSDDMEYTREFFPSVCNLKWIKKGDK